MFTIDGFSIIRSDYGDDADDFSIFVHCELSRSGDAGGEAFSLTVVSPKRLSVSLQHEALLGRGLIIAKEYDEGLLRGAIEPLLVNSETWDEVTDEIEKFFDWI